MNTTSRKRRQKLVRAGKPVNGATGTDSVMAAYGNKRQRSTKDLLTKIVATKK